MLSLGIWPIGGALGGHPNITAILEPRVPTRSTAGPDPGCLKMPGERWDVERKEVSPRQSETSHVVLGR